MLAGMEVGGTKVVCAVSDNDLNLKRSIVVPTTTPEETIGEVTKFFHKFEIHAIGIACFGPIDLRPSSPTYGYITNTPKPDWSNYNIVGAIREHFDVPIGFDTDVNGAVLGEVVKGAAKDCNNAIYMTVGTGIGVGIYCNGGLMHGLIHPEGGHFMIQRHPNDSFEGCCPFHRDCIEGLASGTAIQKRWGKSGRELRGNSMVWELEAYYIAQAVSNYILAYSPEKVILWGGVMHETNLFDLVRQNVKKILNGYVQHELLASRIDEYIVAPGLGEEPGIIGSVCLAKRAIKQG